MGLFDLDLAGSLSESIGLMREIVAELKEIKELLEENNVYSRQLLDESGRN